ncbi:MAG: hypothetical protein F6J94_14685 [Moorea sp. SIO1F2]|uniref:hypothetical protein n=1 Tax=unclassified Moorena TaxID=2683338 RepID=UPI0013BA6632|nr:MULTISPECIES: hypothetical protein [unclassified Moorena]NEN94569.1 hypothetical protein [Moorena sp. SIO3I7]NEO47527.1 hypothetical protein [Moorena sp. SIO4A3]NEO08702.1 hypothetical protein [Moorena sp. SIO3I8]NEO22180.1 hypothetical protein [Moorena sp. SIO4A5]NEP25232.1 hypothetical protein [Moorena sp. SIO3I6]
MGTSNEDKKSTVKRGKKRISPKTPSKACRSLASGGAVRVQYAWDPIICHGPESGKQKRSLRYYENRPVLCGTTIAPG